ncbi:MAG: Ig-like domain-containing protein, partial [Nitrososphaerales archaeon]
LTPSVGTVRLNDQFTITLDSKYLGMPLEDIAIKWSSDAAILVEGDEKTDENGKAEAVFLVNRETPFTIRAEAEGYGYERSEVALNLATESSTPGNVLPDLGNTGQDNSMISYSYFLVLPAIGGVIFWLIKTERLNLPFGRLLERFRGEEE